jgi:hypothetical protein
MTSDELTAATATFDTYAAALVAARAAMPRRKHHRPYPVGSGYHSARAGHSVWIVLTGNALLLRDGSMYDHQRQRPIRP